MIGLAIFGAVSMGIVGVTLALLRIGSGREDRDATLRYGPPGITSAVARRMTGLYVRMPQEPTQNESRITR
jgi:hypothetical protein